MLVLPEIRAKRLGKGRFGDVWLIQGKPPFAAKYIRANERSGLILEKEANTLLRLNHENIVKVYDYGDAKRGEELFFVIRMEYCERNSLREVLQDPKVLYTMKTVLTWAEQIYSVLFYLNGKHIAHRDIKAENVLVTERFNLKLADFGCVKDLDVTGTVGCAGTHRYMAPEIYFREANSATLTKSDLYSASLVLWEIIERRKVYLEYEISQNMQHHEMFNESKMGDHVLLMPKCVHEIAFLVDLCTSYDHTHRPSIERVYQVVLQMNENYVCLDFEPIICENQTVLKRPIGFDGSFYESAAQDPSEVYEDPNWKDRNKRIPKIIASFDFLPYMKTSGELVLKRSLDLSPELFLTNFLPECRTDRKLYAFVYGHIQQVLQLTDYNFMIDEYPSFSKGFELRVIYKMISSRLSEASIKLLVQYLTEQSDLFQRVFQDIHKKYVEAFTHETNDELIASLETLASVDEYLVTNKGPHYALPKNHLKLSIYYDKKNLSNALLLLSRKTKCFMTLDFLRKSQQNGVFMNHDQNFRLNDGTLLDRIDVLGVNAQSLLNILYLPHEYVVNHLAPCYRKVHTPKTLFPFLIYPFQIDMKPSAWPYIIYSTLTAKALNDYDLAHGWVVSQLDGKAVDIYPTHVVPTYFCFYQTRKSLTKNSLILLELPSDGKKQIKCIKGKKRVMQLEIPYEKIDKEKLAKLSFQELEKIIKVNKK